MKTFVSTIIIALTATIAQAKGTMYGDWVFHKQVDEMTGKNTSYISTYAYVKDSKYDFTKPQMTIFCKSMQFTDLDILYGGTVLIKTDKMSKSNTLRFKEMAFICKYG